MQFLRRYLFLFHTLSVVILSDIVSSKNDLYGITVSAADEQQLQRCVFPPNLQILLTPCSEKGDNLTLDLHRNDVIGDADRDALLYSVKNSNDAISIVPYPSGANRFQDTGYYQDTRNGAYLAVTCSKKSRNIAYDGAILHQDAQLLINTQLDGQILSKKPCLIQIRSNSEVSETQAFHKSSHKESLRLSSPEIPSVRNIRDISGSVTSYTVEVLVVVDYSVYKRWLLRDISQTEDTKSMRTKLEIQKYYTQVINGVDLRYRNIGFSDFDIRIKPVGFVIADNVSSFPWKWSRQATTHSSRAQLNADNALKEFRKWLNKTEGLPTHDHAVLFTAHDLYTVKKNGGNVIKHTSGLAFIGTMCRHGDSISVVEEQGGFQSVGTVAHEIGHSLGARHDGEDNLCKSEDRFIMAASGIGPIPLEKRYNPWHFSVCSVDYFREFIASLLANNSMCLLDSPIQKAGEPHSSMPGQIYNPDDQCRLIWGPGSYLCRGAEFGNASSLCTGMYCRDPSTVNDCVLHTAARGTSCGNKQWCIEGKCTYSQQAPESRNGCILGDQPGAAFNGMSCDQLVSQSPSYCYQVKVVARCCSSCQKFFTWRKGCEYGDRVQGCKSWHCNHIFGARDILSDCCRTCNVGDVILPTMQPDWDINTQTMTMPVEGCRDNGMVGNMNCPSLIETYGKYMCYSPSVSSICCKTCQKQADKHMIDCRFGDRSPSLCVKINNVTSLYCSKYRTQCCYSCIRERSSTNRIGSSFAVNFLVFLILIYEYVIK